VQTISFGQEIATLLAADGIEVDRRPWPDRFAATTRAGVMLMISAAGRPTTPPIAAAALEKLRRATRSTFPSRRRSRRKWIALDEIVITPAPTGLLDRFEPLIRVALGQLPGWESPALGRVPGRFAARQGRALRMELASSRRFRATATSAVNAMVNFEISMLN
jgi:hypothetical protein